MFPQNHRGAEPKLSYGDENETSTANMQSSSQPITVQISQLPTVRENMRVMTEKTSISGPLANWETQRPTL